MSPQPPVAQADLEHMLSHGEADWLKLRGERLLITGGTGFFGTWLLEALTAANWQLGTNIETWVLSRNPAAFARRLPHLANAPGIHWIAGDITDFAFPAGTFSHVIHAATAASAQLNATRPREMLDTIVRGTERVLEFAEQHATQRLLLTSSGAVYGPQPPELPGIPETYAGAPDCLSAHSAYAEGKRLSELLCAIAAQQSGIEIKIARCFAFVGPHLPLDAHFAIGNFLSNAIKRTPIIVAGDGRPFRSYLYAADLMIWLLRILIHGEALHPYNVGSDQAITIGELAAMVGDATDNAEVEICLPPEAGPSPRYIPDITRAKKQLDLNVWISLPESIRRTLAWLENTPYIPPPQTP
ncbi:MAG: epimerase [Proteobacteria bacterium]|nr:epimerase [Pseudomonadota bacterium]